MTIGICFNKFLQLSNNVRLLSLNIVGKSFVYIYFSNVALSVNVALYKLDTLTTFSDFSNKSQKLSNKCE